jgi:hypothetical protein
MPNSVEKRGVVEEIGTARDPRVTTKLYVKKNHPNPRAMIPPRISVISVFF